MEIIILFIIVAVLSTYIYRPYQASFAAASWQQNGRMKKETLQELEDSRDSLLQTIKELEFDHEAGKLSTEDFKELNTIYRQKAVTVLKSIDALRCGRSQSQTRDRKSKRQCPVCATVVPAKARFCSHCGNRIHEPNK